MQAFCGGIRSKIVHFKSAISLCSFETNDGVVAVANHCGKSFHSSIRKFASCSLLPLASDDDMVLNITSWCSSPPEYIDVYKQSKFGSQAEFFTPWASLLYRSSRPGLFQWTAAMPTFPSRCIMTTVNPISASQDSSAPVSDLAPRIKFKRLDKTAKHIMQILDKEAVEEVRTKREIPEIKPGYIVQLKVEVPENKRRTSILKGIVIARRNAGLNTTFRLRRLVAGVGVESLFPLYSPSIKEIKVLDKKKVRRAKLYYLRDKMNALRK